MEDEKLAQRGSAHASAPRKHRGMHGYQRRGPALLAMSFACTLLSCGDDATASRDRSESTDAVSNDDRGIETSASPAAGEVDSGTAPSGPPFSVQVCPGASEASVPPDLPPCDGDLQCGAEAHCFPASSAASGLAQSAPDCSVGKCLPDRVFAAQGRVALRQCDGSSGPGVCMPSCLALTRNLLSVFFPLGEAGCGAEEMCIPCANPLDGTPTGACVDRCAAGG